MIIVQILSQIIGVLAVILFGFFIADLLLPKSQLLERLSLGYLLGFGFFTLIIFVLNWKLRISFELSTLSLVLFALLIFSLLVNILMKKMRRVKISYNVDFKKDFGRLKNIEIGMILMTAYLFISTILSNFYWPVTDWDSLVLYDFRAKIFIYTKFVEEAVRVGYVLGYPLFTSLSHMWFYLLGFESPLIFYGFLYISLIILFYSLLIRAGINRKTVMVFSLLLAVSGLIYEHSRWAYTNLPYSIFLFLGIAYLFLWIKKKNGSDIFLSAIFTGLSIWARVAEPFWLVVVAFAILFATILKKYFWVLFYPLVVAAIRYPWLRMVRDFSGQNIAGEKNLINVVNWTTSKMPMDRIIEVGKYLWQYIFSRYLPLLLIYALFLILLPKFIKEGNYAKIFLILIVPGLIAVIIAGTYQYSLYISSWKDIGDSAYRMSMFLIPVSLFGIPIVISKSKDKYK